MNPRAPPEHDNSTFFFMNLPQELTSNLETDKQKHVELTLELNNLCRNINTRSDTAKIQSLQEELDSLSAIIQRTEQAIMLSSNNSTRHLPSTNTISQPQHQLSIPTTLPSFCRQLP